MEVNRQHTPGAGTYHSQTLVVASHTLFPQHTVQEGTLDIHLVQLELFSHGKG
jgi:hypothetical protein